MARVPRKYEPDAMERQVLQRWREQGTFRAQLTAGREAYEASGRDEAHKFVFLEGPPTANGLPHPGHVLTRTLKDSVNRFHAMQGKWVPRKAGWDCHGLPVEIEVQKELGIEHVDQIEEYGVVPFLQKCKESVFRYKGEWEKMSERVGFWVDFDDPYVTMEDGYIESVWWSLKRLFDHGLLIKAHKVVPYSPITGTSYSSHEVAQGYRDVVDTSVFVKFHLKDDPDDARVLSWTTTPWTLPGHVALAVGEDLDYVKVRVTEVSDKAWAKEGEVFIVAKSLVKTALRNHVEVIAEMKGRELLGRRYEPLFPGAIDPHAEDAAPWPVEPEKAWSIVPAGFVTTEDGTGVVHTAVMYGEDDYNLGREIGLPAQHTVGLDGRFTESVPGVAGQYVKDASTEEAILDWLKEHDLLYRTEEYEHSYPHCWRTETPLLYYAMDSWYIRMSDLRDKLLANNERINWVPSTIKEGRMGDWLRNVKDWALSRNRYWGAPLPVWTCSACGHQTAVGSRDELAAHGLEVPELHRPHVDQAIKCPECGGQADREPYVIDVWYESGAAQFAQWNASGLDDPDLREQWPIDFIAEGLDQTRGWFYSLLGAATALGSCLEDEDASAEEKEALAAGLFQGPPYRNCVVNGLILAEDGQKMSKSKKNYVSPDQVFAHVGADATRWYLLSATAPWQDTRFSEDMVRETFGKFFSTLWNTFLFWHQYAELDGWKPDLKVLDGLQETTSGSRLDRWLLSRLEATVETALEEGRRYHLHKATRAIEAFVASDLSNWWVRRSRSRFWTEADSSDKKSAHATLWWALHSVCRLVAPWAPFMVEHIWQHVKLDVDPDSVHLARYPEPGSRDEELEGHMARVRELAEAGRALRSRIGIPTRHPLARCVLVGGDLGGLGDILADELNVKALDETDDVSVVRSHVAKPDRSALGPAFKQDAPKIAQAIEGLDGDRAHATLAAGGTVGVHVEGEEHPLTKEHVTFETEDRDGFATTDVGDVVLAFETTRSQELLDEAFTRELIRRLQDLRKELDLEIDATVELTLSISQEARGRLSGHMNLLKTEVRASEVRFDEVSKPLKSWEVEGEDVAAAVAGVEVEAAEPA